MILLAAQSKYVESFVFISFLGLRCVKARQDLQIFMAISKPHDADLIKSIHNDSTVTQLSKHKSEEEIHQYKMALKRNVLYTSDSCNGVWNTE